MSDKAEETKLAAYLITGGLLAAYSVLQYIESRRRDVRFSTWEVAHTQPLR